MGRLETFKTYINVSAQIVGGETHSPAFDNNILNPSFFTQNYSQQNMRNSEHLVLNDLYMYENKAITLQAWTDPEVSRSLRLPDFKTFGTGRW